METSVKNTVIKVGLLEVNNLREDFYAVSVSDR